MLSGFLKEKVVEFPLKKTSFITDIVDDVATVSINQHYFNCYNENIETVYNFPVYSKADVCSLTVEFAEGKLVCSMKELEEAKAEYTDSKNKGKQTVILEQKSKELYGIKIGNIKANETVKVTICYMYNLSLSVLNDDNVYRFIIPMTISPKYTPKYEIPEIEKISEIDSEIEKVNYNSDFKQSTNVKMNIMNTLGIENIVIGDYNGNILEKKVISVNETFIETETIALDKDFYVDIFVKQNVERNVYVEQDNFVKLMFNEKDTFQRETEISEFIIVVDQSGSMQGDRIINARKSVKTFITLLPANCYFNVYGFGNNYYSFYYESVLFNNEHKKNTIEMIDKKINADLGGTELFKCLNDVLSKPKTHGSRKVILLTDGQVYDNKRLFDLVSNSGTKVFTVGLGNGVSHELVNGIADNSGGTCEIIMNSDLLESKVIKQLKRAMYKETSIKIDNVNHKLIPGEPIYLKDTDIKELKGKFEGVIRESSKTQLNPLRLKWASNEIAKLEKLVNKETNKENDNLIKQIVKLSVENSVVCKYTSLVGTLEQEFELIEEGEVKSRQINIPLKSSQSVGSIINNSSSVSSAFGSLTLGGGTGFNSAYYNSRARGGGSITLSGKINSTRCSSSSSIGGNWGFNGTNDVGIQSLSFEEEDESMDLFSTLEVKKVKISLYKGELSKVLHKLEELYNFDGSFSYDSLNNNFDDIPERDNNESNYKQGTRIIVEFLQNCKLDDKWKLMLEKTVLALAIQR